MNKEMNINIEGTKYSVDCYGEIGEVSLPDLSGEDWRDKADETLSGGLESVHGYKVADGEKPIWLTAWCDQGSILFVFLGEETPSDHVWEAAQNQGYCEPLEYLASFEINPLEEHLESIPADAEEIEGETYRVWVEPQYYEGTCNAPVPHFARDGEYGDGDVLEFDSLEAARDYVHEYYNEPSGYDGIPACNCLSHGQYAADVLTVVRD